jgi:hypothetical protein
MSKIAITGEASRENGAWTLTLKGPSWAIDELVTELNSRKLKVTASNAPEADYAVAVCTTEKKEGNAIEGNVVTGSSAIFITDKT